MHGRVRAAKVILLQSTSEEASSNVLQAEFWNMLLLVTLYMIQGVPLGLTMGAMCVSSSSPHSHARVATPAKDNID